MAATAMAAMATAPMATVGKRITGDAGHSDGECSHKNDNRR
jgi:hypothetical protein